MTELDKLAAPAIDYTEQRDHELLHNIEGGLTKREYAAIHLRVPKSGNEELDALIRKAQRFELAKAAMQALLSNPNVKPDTDSARFFGWADAMLKEGEK